VLRRGGRYAFTVWAKPEEAVGFGAVMRAIETYGTLEVGLPVGPPFFRFSDFGECRRSLEQAGFVRPQVRQLPLMWRVSSADAVFEAVSRGGVRTAALLRAQAPESLAAIREATRRTIGGYGQGQMCAVPMPAVLASARKD